MASIRKSFSIRNGVQVDDDNLIVNSNGLVGIGTSIPTETLDVRGTAKVVGLVTCSSVFATNITVTGVSNLKNITIGITTISSGIITAVSGVVTYYGDGGRLLNLPTSQWLDVDVGLGFTSIYAQGYVGVSTNDPRFDFQVGGSGGTSLAGFTGGVGINSRGNILATGIVTAATFSGSGSGITGINASNISSGTLNNSRLPSNISVSGIITAQTRFVGNLVGIASTAIGITSSSNVIVNNIDAKSQYIGVSTIYNKLFLPNSQPISIGTTNVSGDLTIRRSGITSIVMVSDGSFPSRIIFGRSTSGIGSNGEIRFGNTNGSFPDSTEKSVDIINYDTGSINNYIHNGSIGIGTGNFNWIYGQTLSKIMTLTYDGKLGINQSSPTNTLHVVGTSTITQSAFFGNAISALGNINTPGILTASNRVVTGIASISDLRIRTTSSTYPLQVGTNPDSSGGGVGIDSTGKIITQGDFTGRNINVSGIVTASGAISGSSITAVSSGTISGGAISGTTISGTSLNIGSGTVTCGDISASGTLTAGAINFSNAPDLSGITGSALVFPNLTTTQRNSIGAETGAVIFNTTTNRLELYIASGWVGIGTTA